VKRSTAEGVAKRFNQEQAAKAPLLAWAGLTPTTTADAVQDRALAREARRLTLDAEMAYAHVDYSVRADWHRYVVWTLVDAETFGLLTEWADRPRWGGAFMRLHRWRTAAELAMAGGLLVTMVRSPELLKTLVGAVQGWLASQHGRSVELQIGGDTLKVGGLSAAEQRRLIDEALADVDLSTLVPRATEGEKA